MSIPLLLLLAQLQLALCRQPRSSSTVKPDFVITVRPESVAASSASYASSPCQASSYSQVRRNDYPNALAREGPINQNALVKPLIQAARSSSRYASSAYASSSTARPIQLSSRNDLIGPAVEPSPIYQNALVKPLLEATLSAGNGYGHVYANPQLQGAAGDARSPTVDPYPARGGLVDSFPPRPLLSVPPKNPQLNFPAFVDERLPRTEGLEVAFQWRFLDWVHPTVQLTGKNFTVGNPLSQDVDVDNRGRVFVTSPQWLQGTPVTLSVITDLKGPGGPLLTPYPDWTWHRANCDSLVSVYRVAIDECNRIWMMDTGSASGQSVCPAKLLAFDLKQDQLLLNYVVPGDQTAGRAAQYVNPAVEVGDNCQDTHVYVADVSKHGLLVYSLRENRSWRLDNTAGNAFGNDPEAGRIVIAGESFDLTDGTLGVALSPRGFYAKRYLFFNSLASFYQKFADTDSLKRSRYTSSPQVYQSLARRVSQAGVHAISKTGAMFFQLAEYTALACWNIERPFVPENVVVLAQDPEALQYVSGIKVLTNALGEEELWLNTNRLQKTINNSRSSSEINFRLIRGKVEDLIKGTRCQPTGYTRSEPSIEGWRAV